MMRPMKYRQVSDRPVDHDVGDPFFLHQDFEGAETKGLIENFFDQPFAL